MSSRYKNIHWLQKWYVDYDSTQTDLAERCGVSVKTISNWVNKYELQKNRHDPIWLKDKYVRERHSQREIGELCNTGSSTIGDQLRKYDIQRERDYRDREWLIDKYHREELTLAEIGDSVGTCMFTIRYWCIKHGIARRDCAPEHMGPSHPLAVEYPDSSRLARWSRRVKERDDHLCLSCGTTENLHSHHIVPRYEDQSQKMVYGVDNGETLCQSCHAKRHRERGDEQIAILIRNIPE